jgi:ATP-dependent Clp protease protease subunit
MEMIDKEKRSIEIYNEFGPSWAGLLDATVFSEALKELGAGDITLHINSYGGSVDEALAIIAMLARHDGKVSVMIDSIAASAASLFAAAFPTKISSVGRVMIHNPIGMTYGNADEHRKTIQVLDKYRDSLMVLYKDAMTEKDEKEIQSMLDAETWFSAKESVDVGLASEIIDVRIEARKPKVVLNYKLPPELPQPPAKPDNSYLHEPTRLRALLMLKCK